MFVLDKFQIDRALRLLIFLVFVSFFILAALAPIIQHVKGYPSGENLYSLFSPICHQYPTRCFWIFNLPFALCARCSSIYLGLALAPLFLKSEKKYWVRVLIGITLLFLASIDPILQKLNFYESNNYLRLITGLVAGAGVYYIIYPLKHRRKP